ncbi:MAG TPA: tetratricopeptide repeat protein [Candidatus Acidoferrum sp.]|nr:tetratricopeptide repeat protein [Candidatus Acidoferrum sp.]
MSETASPDKPGPLGNNRFLPFFLGLLLAVATLAVYWPALHYNFLNYDDPDYFTHNPHVLAGLTPASVTWAFTTGHASNWHPLTWLSLMLDVAVFGKGPLGPHLTNLLLHAANAVLVFLLFWRLTAAAGRSALVAALFALHPLHVESVAWVSERKDMLSTCFGLLTLLAYAKAVSRDERRVTRTGPRLSRVTYLRSPCYWLALLAFALGLLAKPMLVTLPFVMLLLDWWPMGRIAECGMRNAESKAKPSTFNPQFSTLLIEKIPFLLLSAASCVVTFVAQHHGGAVAALAKYPLPVRVENAFVSYARYLGKTFWPVDLATPYPYVAHWPWAGILSAVALVVGLSLVVVGLRRRYPFLLTGWFWFVGTLVPVIGLVQVGDQSMADRYSYVPLIGVFVILAWGGWEVWRLWRLPKAFVVPVAALLLAAAAWQTRIQSGYWHDSATLFRHMLTITKNNYTAYVNLGTTLSAQGDIQGAIDCFRQAQQLNPLDPTVLYNLGNGFAELGLWDDAIAAYHSSLNLVPNQPDTLNNLGLALTIKRQLAEATACFEAALKLDPECAGAHNNLATMLYREHQFDGALAHFREAVRLTPDDPQIHANLGDTLAKLGQTNEAVRCYQEALRLKPDYSAVRTKLQALGAPASN